jgi:hypothetical protein
VWRICVCGRGGSEFIAEGRTFAEMRSVLDQSGSGTNPFVDAGEGGIGEVEGEGCRSL